MLINLAVLSSNPSCTTRAESIAHDLSLPLLNTADSSHDYFLLVTPDYIGIQANHSRSQPLYVDFSSPKLAYRQSQASLRKETLARAIGLKPDDHPFIVDATAGLGQDSLILAGLGFKVTLLERSPIVHLLLQDGLERAKKTNPASHNLTLIHINAISWLQQQHTQPPQVVYLDPMFPEKSKSAQVKKEMQILQDIAGKDLDSEVLFNAALACATKRVVVKRPRLATFLSIKKPTFQLIGKSSRFDIYELTK